MENNTNIWVVIVIAVFVIGVIAYTLIAANKRKNASWTGTVIDKKVVERNEDSNRNTVVPPPSITFGNTSAIKRYYSLRIKDDTGKEFYWPVGEGLYASVEVGDTLIKNPGTETPVQTIRQ